MKCRKIALTRNRVGPFLGQVLQNTSCSWNEPVGGASTKRGVNGAGPIGAAAEIFKNKFAELERQRLHEEESREHFVGVANEEEMCSR